MQLINNSVGLMRQSWRVLRADSELILFPIMSAVAGTLVMLSFLGPLALLVPWEALAKNEPHAKIQFDIMHYALMLGFYIINFSVINFFNSALAACVMERFRGGNPTLRFGLRAAASRIHHIVGWAVLSATVGMIIKAVQERVGIVGKIVTAFLGVAWTIASYFVVPVLIAENLGPIDALKRSGSLMSKTWGTALVSNLGMGLVSFALGLLVIIPMGGGITMIALGASGPKADPLLIGLGIALVALSIILIMAWALISSTLRAILNTALYHFAVHGAAPAGFDESTMRAAFRTKTK